VAAWREAKADRHWVWTQVLKLKSRRLLLQHCGFRRIVNGLGVTKTGENANTK
jgi:hypothetical protein